jgi:hypothetical protein
VGAQVALRLAGDFENYSTFTPQPAQNDLLVTMLNELISWAQALQTLRNRAEVVPGVVEVEVAVLHLEPAGWQARGVRQDKRRTADDRQAHTDGAC